MQHRLTKSGKLDRRMFNGGARPGAGRPRSQIHPIVLEYALEEVVVKEFRHGQMRRVKKPRIIVVLEKLHEIGMRGGKDGNGDVKALCLWLDYAIGKPEIQRVPKGARGLRRDRGYSPKYFGDLHLEELIETSYKAHEQMDEGTFLPKLPLTS